MQTESGLSTAPLVRKREIHLRQGLELGQPRVGAGFFLQDRCHCRRHRARQPGIEEQQAPAPGQHVFDGAGVLVAGREAGLKQGVLAAQKAIDGGAAEAALAKLIEVSNG